MKRFFLLASLFVAVLIVGYFLGPTAHSDGVVTQPIMLDNDLSTLEQSITDAERNANLRPDNEARIVWADRLSKRKTPYCLVYIPGFSASWAEGDPVHRRLAKRFGCNLYLARTAEHGVNSPDALKLLTPSSYAHSAERALAIGKKLGDKVIVMGTSAGGMLALYLADHHPEIDGLILYSPCIATANPALQLVTKPWGKQLLSRIFPDDHVVMSHYTSDRARYWLPQYHSNGLLVLQTMLDQFMTPAHFQRIKQPVFMGYYYKDDEHQDNVVSVPAMLIMYDALGTPASQKMKVDFPTAGAHVIASHFTSQAVEEVYQRTESFMRDLLHLPLASAAVASTHYQPKK